MKSRIVLNTSDDRGYWINWDKFFPHIDHEDLALRDSRTVLDYYLSSWFYEPEEDVHLFKPPAFTLRLRYARFINGRHRTILLSKHMKHIPMALTQINPDHEWILDEVSVRSLSESEVFEIPDFEIKDAINIET